ncbi:hypothetical protein RD792_000347 [Penstemon davidsonii]|nr:hypothetical protein RD792_000347 [Penstemon davidsonii]
MLRLHCASGDDDLGFHTTPVNFDFKWHFCDNFWGNTLFFCHLWWGSKNISFDVFKSSMDYDCGPDCYWEVKSDGIYFSVNPTEYLEKKYSW